MAVIINKKGLSAVIHLTGNATINVAGNSSVSDIAVGDEIVTGATITQVWYGTGNGAYWEIKRGSNTVMFTDSTGYLDFAGNGITLNLDTTETLVANLNLSQTGFIVIELTKSPTKSTYA